MSVVVSAAVHSGVLLGAATTQVAAEFLRALTKAVPYRIHEGFSFLLFGVAHNFWVNYSLPAKLVGIAKPKQALIG